MRGTSRRLVGLLLLVVAFALPACSTARKGAEPMRILAAASLVDLLGDAVAAFPTAGSLTVRCQFGASSQLRRQVEAGARADLFLTPDPRDLDALQAAGLLLPGTRRDLFRNQLVLIQPARATLRLRSLEDLRTVPLPRVAMGDPGSVPAGRYARQALGRLGLYDVLENRRVLATTVRVVLDWAARGEVDAAIVYATDARAAADRVRVVATFPASSHDPIVYPGAVLASSPHPVEARAFLDALSSSRGQALARQHGFEPFGAADLRAASPAP